MDYDYQSIQNHVSAEALDTRPPGVWKYHELLPISKNVNVISLGEGGTYLHKAQRIADKIGLSRLWIKDETTNPTGSFIDRGVTVEVSKARELGLRNIACGTTGNLGASLAAYTAKAGMKCKVFLSPRIDVGKLYQIITYGAEAESTNDYEEALSKAASLEGRFYVASEADPFLLEGLKTTGYEICEQTGWNTPRNIIVPMGDGGHLSMIWRGINELLTIGLLRKTNARMIGVQAQGSSPIVKAFKEKKSHPKRLDASRTIAIDIGMMKPIHGNLALQAIIQSKGLATTVSDSEMLNAASLLAKTEGLFAEPASASTIASLTKLIENGEIDKDEDTICVLTGAGLKDPSSARKLIQKRKSSEKLLKRVGEPTITTRITGTKLHILEIIGEHECYGYELRKKLSSHYELQVSLPTIYQHLNELETMRLVEPRRTRKETGKRERNYYALSERGKVILKGSASIC
jgi:threonine synthase